jgi:subtilisin family serine protease
LTLQAILSNGVATVRQTLSRVFSAMAADAWFRKLSRPVGVAKQVLLLGVRVFNCSGGSSMSLEIAAVDWVTAYHVKPAVANMSLGVGPRPRLHWTML